METQMTDAEAITEAEKIVHSDPSKVLWLICRSPEAIEETEGIFAWGRAACWACFGTNENPTDIQSFSGYGATIAEAISRAMFRLERANEDSQPLPCL